LNMHDVQSQSRNTRRRQVLTAQIAVLLPASFAAIPAAAQKRDTVVVRRVSSWQVDVDRLKQELLNQRNLESQFLRKFNEIEMRRRVALPDSQPKLLAQAQLMYSQWREASLEQRKIARRLESLCETVRIPEGWLGVVTTGIQMQDKRPDGTKIIRFLEPPIVASVDPGSPAERVGVRAGDVLVEVGGHRVLQQNIVFADLLHPGRAIALKVQRGGEVFTLTPTVEQMPEAMASNSCAKVDIAAGYFLSPRPAQAPTVVRMRSAGAGGQGYAYTYSTNAGRDSNELQAAVAAPTATTSGVMTGPMVGLFGGGANSLAGLQLIALSTESSRALGVDHGILVNQVLQGTPGREAGLRGGDILLLADSVELRSIGTLQRVIRNSTDRRVTMVIMRDRKRETVMLKW
jgi:C-terminal processing protease CtpA/Prc